MVEPVLLSWRSFRSPVAIETTAQDVPGDSRGTTQATATSTTDPDDLIGDIPLIEGKPAPETALALSEQLAEILASVTEEFGDVGVDLLQFGPHFTSLYFVDPAMPDTPSRSEYLDATWSDPGRLPRRGTMPPTSTGSATFDARGEVRDINPFI